MKDFDEDLKRRDLLNRVRQDLRSGIRSGVTGTPALYLNGFRFDHPPMYELLKQAIRLGIAKEHRAQL